MASYHFSERDASTSKISDEEVVTTKGLGVSDDKIGGIRKVYTKREARRCTGVERGQLGG